MKKLTVTFAGIMLALGSQAQTVVGTTTSNTTVQGISNVTIKSQYVSLDAGSAILLNSPSIQTTGSISTTGSVTAAKGYIQGMDIGNEIINSKDSIVRNNAAIESKKADKTALADETNSRIDGDKQAEQNANTYTDSRLTSQSGSDRGYTDKAVSAERDRAIAAEAELRKETKQVGAMAMAAAGVAGATPVGDKKSAVSMAAGTYSGQSAIAVGITHLINERTKVFGAVSGITSGNGKTGATVGASYSF